MQFRIGTLMVAICVTHFPLILGAAGLPDTKNPGDTNKHSRRVHSDTGVPVNEPMRAEPARADNADDGGVAGGICGPLNICGDPDCSTAIKCANACFGNPTCASQCGGNSCNIGCSPCASGCQQECNVAVCPQNICSRAACHPECNTVCVTQFDPCDCFGACDDLCPPALCNPACNPLIPPACNPACDGDACAPGCLDRCNDLVCAISAQCDPDCAPSIPPACNPVCPNGDLCGIGCDDYCNPVLCPTTAQCDQSVCDPAIPPQCNPVCGGDPCQVLCDPCNPLCGGDPCAPECPDLCLCEDAAACDRNCFPPVDPACNPACPEEFNLCDCAPGPCNIFCVEYDICACAGTSGVCNPLCGNYDPCLCAPGPCSPYCPEFDYCACAEVNPEEYDPCVCDPCGPTCKPECNPLCDAWDLCTCEPCICEPCGPTCKPSENPNCEEYDPCEISPGPCNPFCVGKEFDVCACAPCLGYPVTLLCPETQKNPCLCDPCGPGCPDRCSSACNAVCFEDCPQYDHCECAGPCLSDLAPDCFDFCKCHPCICDHCSAECRAQDPCAGAGCEDFDPCECSPCSCDPNSSIPGYDLCLCEPCRAECHPECNPACGEQYDPCLCDPCGCDPCGPTCFPECNPQCFSTFNVEACIASAPCNPRFGGESLCNPLCGGDPCNSIHCALFESDCRLLAIVDCLSGPEKLPDGPGVPVTPFDCLRIFDVNKDGDVDLDDFSKSGF